MPRPSKLTVEVHSDADALRSMADEWHLLADKSACTQFGTPAYAMAFWKSQGSGTLRVVTVHKDSALVGLLPVYERKLGAARVIRWLGHGFGTVGQALIDPALDEDEVASAMWDALAEASPAHAALQLIEYRAGGLGLRALRRSDAWGTFLEMRSMIPTISLEGATLEDILAGSARRKLRHTITRAERSLEEAGHRLEIEAVETRAAFDRVLPDIDRVFDIAESHASKMHMFQGDLREMSLNSIRDSMDDGSTVVFIVRIDGIAVAFDISIVVNNTMFGYVRRHDPACRDYSPGHLLMRHGVSWAIDHKLSTFDLGLGDSDYKRRWATDWYDAVFVTGGRTGYAPVGRALTAGIDSAFKLRSFAQEQVRQRLPQD